MRRQVEQAINTVHALQWDRFINPLSILFSSMIKACQFLSFNLELRIHMFTPTCAAHFQWLSLDCKSQRSS